MGAQLASPLAGQLQSALAHLIVYIVLPSITQTDTSVMALRTSKFCASDASQPAWSSALKAVAPRCSILCLKLLENL